MSLRVWMQIFFKFLVATKFLYFTFFFFFIKTSLHCLTSHLSDITRIKIKKVRDCEVEHFPLL